MNNSVKAGKWNMAAVTFVNVDSAKQVALKDLALSSSKTLSLGSNQVELFGAGGNPLTIVEDEQLYADFPEAYAALSVNPKAEVIFTFDGTHWYLVADGSCEYIMDTYVIKEGQGIYVNCAKTLNKGLTVTFSGAVTDHALPVTVKTGKWSMSGNSTPVDRALSEFVMTTTSSKALSLGNNQVELFGAGGNPLTIVEDEQLYADFPEAYAALSVNPKAEVIFTFDGTHWYLVADGNCEYVMDAYVIKAGQGIYVNSGKTLNKGLTFEIPKPIDD